MKADISKKPKFHPDEVNELSKESPNVERLDFSIDIKSENIIKQEIIKYKEWTDRLCVDYTIFEEFGKEQCKKFKVSPDAIMQLAFQLAFYTLEGKLAPVYESCSTAAFKHGRTETIRPCTLATKALCVAMTQNNRKLSKTELQKMILDCSKIHNVLTREAAMGN